MADGFEEWDEVFDLLDTPGDSLSIRTRVDLVNDENLIIEGGAVFGVFGAADADVGAHGVGLLHPGPPGAEGGAVVGHAFTHDGDEAPTGVEAFERLLDVNRRVVGIARTGDAAGGRRERLVHHHNVSLHLDRQRVVQLLGVFREHAGEAAEGFQEIPAAVGEFVDVDFGPGDLAEDGHAADALTRPR